ncbi:MAG: hypothetical protein WCH61_06945 [bacterium]
MNQTYYSRWKGRIAGPYTATQIQEELRAKRLSRFHEISTDQRDWRPLAELPELLPKPPPAPVVAAPVITPADVRPASRRPVTPREELNDEEGDSTTNLSREVRRDGGSDTRKQHGRTPDPDDDDEERTLPRVRRAPANNHEAADRDNAWAPPGQSAFCSSCGKPIMIGAVICPRCGVPTDRRATAAPVFNFNQDQSPSFSNSTTMAWSTGTMVLLCIGALAIPLLGWVLGGINLKYPERKNQAIALIILGLSAFATVILLSIEN